MADDLDATLAIKELRAGYGSLDILNGVELSVPQGQFVALMAPNGAGKSTLLKTLYGMTTIKGGSISWGGRELAGLSSRAILGRGISFVPQGRCNFPVMSRPPAAMPRCRRASRCRCRPWRMSRFSCRAAGISCAG